MSQPELYSSDWYQQQKLASSIPNDGREQPRNYHLLNTIQK
ncbi:4926_t:CDS:1, partial [Paraglomus occultum]